MGVAVRSSSGANVDFPYPAGNVNICPDGFTYVSDPHAALASGKYSVFGFYRTADGVYHNLPAQSVTVGGGTPTPTPVPTQTTPPPTGGTKPVGPTGTWTLKFADEFSGTAVDTSKWSYISSAEGDHSSNPVGTGNLGNQQLEFDQPANCTVAAGSLDIHGQAASITSSSGQHYAWSSCMLNSSPSYSFQYGYLEFRAQLPGPVGWWSSGWTWAAPGQNLSANGETDVWENYSDQHSREYLTQHQGSGGGVTYAAPFDDSTGYHTYGADMEPTGTTWYIDGVNVGHAAGTASGLTNILLDNFAYSGNGNSSLQPTGPSDFKVDYVHVFTKG